MIEQAIRLQLDFPKVLLPLVIALMAAHHTSIIFLQSYSYYPKFQVNERGQGRA